MVEDLRNSLERINSGIPIAAIEEAIYKITNYEAVSLLTKNEVFMDYLQNGVQVSFQDKGEMKSTIVYLVDYDDRIALLWQINGQSRSTKRRD